MSTGAFRNGSLQAQLAEPTLGFRWALPHLKPQRRLSVSLLFNIRRFLFLCPLYSLWSIFLFLPAKNFCKN